MGDRLKQPFKVKCFETNQNVTKMDNFIDRSEEPFSPPLSSWTTYNHKLEDEPSIAPTMSIELGEFISGVVCPPAGPIILLQWTKPYIDDNFVSSRTPPARDFRGRTNTQATSAGVPKQWGAPPKGDVERCQGGRDAFAFLKEKILNSARKLSKKKKNFTRSGGRRPSPEESPARCRPYRNAIRVRYAAWPSPTCEHGTTFNSGPGHVISLGAARKWAGSSGALPHSHSFRCFLGFHCCISSSIAGQPSTSDSFPPRPLKCSQRWSSPLVDSRYLRGGRWRVMSHRSLTRWTKRNSGTCYFASVFRLKLIPTGPLNAAMRFAVVQIPHYRDNARQVETCRANSQLRDTLRLN
ncbi:hypothetical protein EVAR_78859_1 [Eumeta japonica]|uniref:Uncharacterized protein n=1 Tax=Eumeta variegata TaxID=151549 RepID=A0A4C1U285_EUMVA|nr:hypothetical protein EVAR_78859_1 [Eumeta japonica]